MFHHLLVYWTSVCWLLLANAATLGAQTSVLDSLRRLPAQAPNPEARLEAQLELSVAYLRVNTDSVLAISAQVLAEARKSHPPLAAKAADQIGMAWMLRGKADSALQYFELSKDISISHNYIRGLVQYNNSMGRLMNYQMNYEKAEYFYKEGIRLADSLHEELPLRAFYANLGALMGVQKRHAESITYLKLALPYYERSNDSLNRAILYGNLGTAFLQMGITDSAIGYTLKSIQIKRQIGDQHGLVASYGTLADVYETRKDWNKAIESNRHSIKIGMETKKYNSVMDRYISIIKIYLKTDHSEHALALADSALAFAGSDMAPYRLTLHQQAATACANLRHYQQALKHWEQAQVIAIELNAIADIKKIEEEIKICKKRKKTKIIFMQKINN